MITNEPVSCTLKKRKEKKKKRLVIKACVMYFIKRDYFIWVAIMNGLAWELVSACFSCLCLCNNITKQWRGWLCAESAAWACPACRWARQSCSPGPTPMGRDPKPWPQNMHRASPSAPHFWWRCCGESTLLCEWCVLITGFLCVPRCWKF